jgi:hypothetical protein
LHEAQRPTILRHHGLHPAVPVEITDRHAATFAGHFFGRAQQGAFAESALPVAEQERLATAVLAHGAKLFAEEVLGQQEILTVVAIEVRHGQPKHRRDFCSVRKWPDLETVAAVQQHDRGQPADFRNGGLGQPLPENSGDVGHGKGSVRRERGLQPRQSSVQLVQ